MSDLERLKKVVKWLIFNNYAKNEADLASKISVTKSYFSQVMNDKVPLSEKFIRSITALNKNINDVWIFEGRGEMLKDQDFGNVSDPTSVYSREIDNTLVSLLPLSAQAGTLNDFVVGIKEADCEKIISPIKGVDFAITVSGDSMAPEYPSGTQVFIKKINEKAFIDWGRTYVLDTCNGVVMKRVVPGSAEGCVKCISINPDPIFAPFEVSLKDVFGIYRVLLSMSVK
jgi:phage repressor protein C with HTH and peptisase S24 domain